MIATRLGICAHKKGEVVGPAGGETGGPHCLAEVYLLLKKQHKSERKLMLITLYVKQKNKRTANCKGYIPTPCPLSNIIIQAPAQKYKDKIAFSLFFSKKCPRIDEKPKA